MNPSSEYGKMDTTHARLVEFINSTHNATYGNVSINIHVPSLPDAGWATGGNTYIIFILSVLVVLAFLFAICGLFHKAEAHKKHDDIEDDDNVLSVGGGHHDQLASPYLDPTTLAV